MIERLARWWPALLLGLATIGAYGTAYYAIGVLIPVIAEETGWSSSLLSAGFSLGVLGQGGIALLAGHTFDRRGSRPVLLPAIALGATLLLLASMAQAPWHFVLTWALGGAIIGGGLYYNVTMPVTARLYPNHRAAAFSILTLLGALASPIFYPVAAWFVDLWGWRGGLQGLIVLTVLCVAPAALFVRAPAASRPRDDVTADSLIAALRRPAVYRVLLVFALAGLANAAVLLHQVGALQAAGLSLAAASAFAGMRGAFQIPGRLFLTPLTARFGVRGAIGGCYALGATASLALLIAVGGTAPFLFGFYFTAIGGIAFGLLSPLNGLFQTEVYGDARLGTLNGVSVVVTSIAAALGAWLAGLLVDLTGSYLPMVAAVALLQALAVAALLWQRAADPAHSTPPVPSLTPQHTHNEQ
ncbi:MAG: MFS transporter [Dehalococcoidia bacterium]